MDGWFDTPNSAKFDIYIYKGGKSEISGPGAAAVPVNAPSARKSITFEIQTPSSESFQ